jgi:hypothetical protein
MASGAELITDERRLVTFDLTFIKGAVMKSKWSVMKSVVVAVALVAGVAGVARADDSSMSRFGGDGYAYFHEDKPVVSRAPSGFRREDPHGLTESQYQTLSSEGPEWQPRASIDRTLPTFRKTDPHGLSISEYQALSSNDSMWQEPATSPTSVAGSPNAAIANNAVQ